MGKRRVLVIGGGVSGLVCARGLAEKGCEVVLLEAKDRLGGRILTRESNGALVELGAEFVHGNSKAMQNVLGDAGLKVIDVSEKNRVVKAGRMKEVDLWGRVGDVLDKIEPRGGDTPFREWIEGSSFGKEDKEMALAFVEGFNASDARIIGSHALLRAEFESQRSCGDKQRRIADGYAALVEAVRAAAAKSGARIELKARVKIVKWQRGAVSVKCEDGGAFEGEAAVITLPLGVLKSGQVVFEPSLPHKREAIETLKFGNVAKLVFVFRRRWWSAELEDDFGFVHAFDQPVPTSWSDSRGPTLVGWAAGPKGEVMLNLSREALREKAVEIMAKVFSKDASEIEREILAFEFHDWRSDPDIAGAYSYIPVNGLDLPKALAAPVEQTLFFAGEATAMDAQMGTVSGAIESGLRVVAEIC